MKNTSTKNDLKLAPPINLSAGVKSGPPKAEDERELAYEEGRASGIEEEGIGCYEHSKEAYERGKKGLPFADEVT